MPKFGTPGPITLEMVRRAQEQGHQQHDAGQRQRHHDPDFH